LITRNLKITDAAIARYFVMVNNPAYIPIYLIVAAVHAKEDGDDARDIGIRIAFRTK
jgi:hypothetical protein